jgi:hypothetical protein
MLPQLLPSRRPKLSTATMAPNPLAMQIDRDVKIPAASRACPSKSNSRLHRQRSSESRHEQKSGGIIGILNPFVNTIVQLFAPVRFFVRFNPKQAKAAGPD